MAKELFHVIQMLAILTFHADNVLLCGAQCPSSWIEKKLFAILKKSVVFYKGVGEVVNFATFAEKEPT